MNQRILDDERSTTNAVEVAAPNRMDSSDATSMVTRLIGDHPVVAVAAAATLGAVLGWVIKRR